LVVRRPVPAALHFRAFPQQSCLILNAKTFPLFFTLAGK
jgi:hypothetical protein